jgi:hypothetical protein
MMTSPGAHHALLGQERVLHAHAADLVVVRDALLAHEVAHHLGLLGGLDVLVGRVVVGHEHDTLGVPDRSTPVRRNSRMAMGAVTSLASTMSRLQLMSCPRGSCPWLDLFEAGVGGEDLLGDRHGAGHAVAPSRERM